MKIKEAAQASGLSVDTLRYYEKIRVIPPVQKTDSGIRDYDETSLRWIDFIVCLRNAGISIETIREYTRLATKGDKTIALRKDLLIKQRELVEDKIRKLTESMCVINYKIDHYEEIAEKTDRLINGKSVV